MTEIILNLKIPTVPNFIYIESLPGKREDGWNENAKISIADLNEDQLENLADEWKTRLIQRAAEIRASRKL